MVNPLRLSDDQVVPLIVFGGVAAVAGGVALGRWLVTRRRRRAYEAFCQTRGYRFDAARPGEEARHAATCRLFTAGRRRRWTFTIAGTSGGTPFTAFEYRWTTGSGKSARSHRIAGLLWTVERSLPQFFVAPEGWGDKVAAYFGGQDMDFDDSPDFSHSYRLRGADEAAVRALFTPARRQRLEQLVGQHVSGAGNELMWWRDATLPTPDAFDEFLMEGERVRRAFTEG